MMPDIAGCWNSVQEVSGKLTGDGDPSSLLGEIVGAAIAATGAEAGFILLASPSDGQPVLAASRGLTSSIEELVATYGAMGCDLFRAIGRPVLLAADAGLPDADLLAFALHDAGFHEVLATPLTRRDGRPLGTMAVLCTASGGANDRVAVLLDLLARQASDAVERHRALVELARERASLRAIFDNVADCVLLLDGANRIQSANPAALPIFGHAPDELVGRHLSTFINEPFAAPGRSLTCAVRHLDGSARSLEITASDGGIAGSRVLLLRDVTERIALQSRMRQADRLAALGTLAAGLGHDMNNMLFPIRAHLNAIAARAARCEDAEASRSLDEVFRGIDYLQQLADGLHFLVQEPEDSTGSDGPTDLAGWWAASGPILGRSLPPLSAVEADIPETLPPVRIGAPSLTQAVLNLFVNSAEAIVARADGIRGLVRVHARPSMDGREVCLSIADNGMGMPESVRLRALDMFFTTKTRSMGTGLGLAMVARVLKGSGGRVSIESEVGQGTVVSLHVPVADRLAAEGHRVEVRMADGRSASLVSGLLRGRGIGEASPDERARADAWIVEHGSVDPDEAATWLSEAKGRSVFVFGAPESARGAWARAGADVLGPAGDFDALLDGVDRVCSSLQRKE